MRIDPQSAWYAKIDGEVRRSFDTPRCALSGWTRAPSKTTLFVQDYYGRVWHSGDEVRFVVGSDVTGPMGADLVPVLPVQTAKFIGDHGGHALAVGEVTEQVLRELR
jgi:hypothetical protein